MANEEHLKILEQGVEVWNRWREENPDIPPDLNEARFREAYFRGADLRGANLIKTHLSNVDLIKADLRGADLTNAYLIRADLSGANLSGANLTFAGFIFAKLLDADLSEAHLSRADLGGANLLRANLSGADLTWANLSKANLSRANLSKADLTKAILVETNFADATLAGCSIYGISAWDINLEGATQSDLIISPEGQPTITVDNLEVAQFLYLLLYNEKIRHIIDTITSKVVLILGRFTPERKAVLDAMRDELRRRDYLPVLFDFEKPSSRDLTETISALAHMARFVIADITEPRSIPQELYAIVPHMRSVPVQPLLESSASEYGMFGDLRSYPWVLDTYRYNNSVDLLASLQEKVIDPAEMKAKELRERT